MGLFDKYDDTTTTDTGSDEISMEGEAREAIASSMDLELMREIVMRIREDPIYASTIYADCPRLQHKLDERPDLRPVFEDPDLVRINFEQVFREAGGKLPEDEEEEAKKSGWRKCLSAVVNHPLFKILKFILLIKKLVGCVTGGGFMLLKGCLQRLCCENCLEGDGGNGHNVDADADGDDDNNNRNNNNNADGTVDGNPKNLANKEALNRVADHMEQPEVQEAMKELLDNDPEGLQEAIDNDPELRALRDSSPLCAELMSDPDTMKIMVEPDNLRALGECPDLIEQDFADPDWTPPDEEVGTIFDDNYNSNPGASQTSFSNGFNEDGTPRIVSPSDAYDGGEGGYGDGAPEIDPDSFNNDNGGYDGRPSTRYLSTADQQAPPQGENLFDDYELGEGEENGNNYYDDYELGENDNSGPGEGYELGEEGENSGNPADGFELGDSDHPYQEGQYEEGGNSFEDGFELGDSDHYQNGQYNGEDGGGAGAGGVDADLEDFELGDSDHPYQFNQDGQYNGEDGGGAGAGGVDADLEDFELGDSDHPYQFNQDGQYNGEDGGGAAGGGEFEFAGDGGELSGGDFDYDMGEQQDGSANPASDFELGDSDQQQQNGDGSADYELGEADNNGDSADYELGDADNNGDGSADYELGDADQQQNADGSAGADYELGEADQQNADGGNGADFDLGDNDQQQNADGGDGADYDLGDAENQDGGGHALGDVDELPVDGNGDGIDTANRTSAPGNRGGGQSEEEEGEEGEEAPKGNRFKGFMAQVGAGITDYIAQELVGATMGDFLPGGDDFPLDQADNLDDGLDAVADKADNVDNFADAAENIVESDAAERLDQAEQAMDAAEDCGGQQNDDKDGSASGGDGDRAAAAGAGAGAAAVATTGGTGEREEGEEAVEEEETPKQRGRWGAIGGMASALKTATKEALVGAVLGEDLGELLVERQEEASERDNNASSSSLKR